MFPFLLSLAGGGRGGAQIQGCRHALQPWELRIAPDAAHLLPQSFHGRRLGTGPGPRRQRPFAGRVLANSTSVNKPKKGTYKKYLFMAGDWVRGLDHSANCLSQVGERPLKKFSAAARRICWWTSWVGQPAENLR